MKTLSISVLIALTIIISVNCSNSLIINKNVERNKKTIVKDVNKYELSYFDHFMASNKYVDFYFSFINREINVRPNNYANFCFLFNESGYLLKLKNYDVCTNGGCNVNPYSLLHQKMKDSTFNMFNDNLVEVDSTYNFIDFINTKDVYPINDSVVFDFEGNQYLAVFHWGIFCNSFNRNTSFNIKYIENLNLPIKSIFLNVDYKE